MSILRTVLSTLVVVALGASARAAEGTFQYYQELYPLPSDDTSTGRSSSSSDFSGSALTNTHTTFHLTFGSGLTGNTAAQQAFQTAADMWSAVLRDNVTINVAVDYQSLGAGILGATGSTTLYGPTDTISNLLRNSADSGAGYESLLARVPSASQMSVKLPAGAGYNGSAYLNQANYLALGGNRLTDSDGSITFSSNYQWDFDPTDGISAGKFDFVGCAAHEIGHLLGFVSNVDSIDGQPTTSIGPTTLDYFRFSNASLAGGIDFTTAQRDMTPGDIASFYYGSGSVLMATGVSLGDGRQASHWKDGLGLGLMDPTAGYGERLAMGQNDLIAMDLIGWNVTVPEPSSVLLLVTALLAIAVCRRRPHHGRC